MKKIFLYVLVLILLPINVFAYEYIDERCDTKLKASLKSEAQNLVYRVSKNIVGDDVTYDLKFYNLSGNLKFTDEDGNAYGEVISNLKPGSKVTLYIYGSDSYYCAKFKVLTKTIEIPYYNKYFTSELCEGYESYYLCSENSNVNLTQTEFETKLREYKDSLKKEHVIDTPEPTIEEKTFLDYFLDNLYIILAALFIILIILIIKIVKDANKDKGIL